MWTAIKGLAKGNEVMGWDFDIPHDPDDFRRCLLFYQQCNLTKADLNKVSEVFKWWKPFIDNWDELTRLFEEESPRENCPKLYKFIQKLIKEAKILAKRN
ncbi:MAG: hypothetical protein A2V66_16665 [Ignavibacteria bacterium RBG_13_36_8]|nr:MAG: hypothetical protein A2V66_16665 [Ignavibacteria bacterium RBG_13_36_8]